MATWARAKGEGSRAAALRVVVVCLFHSILCCVVLCCVCSYSLCGDHGLVPRMAQRLRSFIDAQPTPTPTPTPTASASADSKSAAACAVYDVGFSMLEVLDEQTYDLLDPDNQKLIE
jgi:hypothetical protein